jgi:hypothetical protein
MDALEHNGNLSDAFFLRASFFFESVDGWMGGDGRHHRSLDAPTPTRPSKQQTNTQCTTPDDMSIAERFLDEAAEAAAKEAAGAVAARAA